MGLEEIKAEIIKEAEKKAVKILREAEEKAKRILTEAEEKAMLIKQNAKKDAEKEAEKIMQSVSSSAKIEAGKKILKAKHEILALVLEETVKTFTSGEEYEKCLEKSIIANEKNALKIFLSKQDFEKFRTKSSKLEASNIKGGFIAKFAGFEVNTTIDSLLKTNEQELMREAGKILFY